jgi:hypothetical protein
MKTNSLSEKTFALLLRLYPRAFREEYAEPMRQHFRDQKLDTQKSRNPFAWGQFWLEILADTLKAAIRARLDQFRQILLVQPNQFMNAKVPSFRFLFFAFLAPLIAGVLIYLDHQPREYLGITRLLIESSNQTLSGYAFLQAQPHIITSTSILEPVVQQLGWAKRFSTDPNRLTDAEAALVLRQNILVTIPREVPMIELRVFAADREQAALLANTIADVYLRSRPAAVRIEILDRAQPPINPVRPNIPAGLVSGIGLSVLMSIFASWLLRTAFKSGVGSQPTYPTTPLNRRALPPLPF